MKDDLSQVTKAVSHIVGTATETRLLALELTASGRDLSEPKHPPAPFLPYVLEHLPRSAKISAYVEIDPAYVLRGAAGSATPM